MITNLNVLAVENGFIVHEELGAHLAVGVQHVFETSEALGTFISKWGKDIETEKEQANKKDAS